jgi:hypothetical protein
MAAATRRAPSGVKACTLDPRYANPSLQKDERNKPPPIRNVFHHSGKRQAPTERKKEKLTINHIAAVFNRAFPGLFAERTAEGMIYL